MGLNLTDLKYQIVEPALVAIGLNTAAGLNLVTGTALAESGAQYLVQTGGGPALGIFQMEPATEQDIWTNFLEYNPSMAAHVRAILSPGKTTPQLVWNLIYAAAMCRIKYWRAPSELPVYNDAQGMAAYHKVVYNTVLGVANAATNVPFFVQAIAA